MSSRRKQRGENTVRIIEDAARILNMNIGEFFKYVMNKENEKLSQVGNGSMRNLLHSGNPIEINQQAKYEADRFHLLKAGNEDSSFIISDYYVKWATLIVRSRKPRGQSSHHRECSVRTNGVSPRHL